VNVAHARRGADITALLQRYGCQIHWLRAQAQTLGLINPYLHPAQLGADRWAGLLGVQARLAQPQPPFLLASFGTATTIDTVGPDQIFAGGLILPGPAMMRKALQEGTAKLPYATGSVAAFPNDTHTAIASGIAAAQAGAVLRQLLASRERYGSTPALYVSGGGWFEVGEELERLLTDIASAFATLLKPMYIDYPVLEGLAALARAQHATLF
jgi:type III pantothenate kinase